MAAAIGAGLPVKETRASMVVDVGGGTTDVAIISLGGVVTSRTVRIGGDEIDDALVAHVKSEYSLLLGERSAEDLKIGAGSAFPLREELSDAGPRARPRDRAAQDGLDRLGRGAPRHRDPDRADRRAGAHRARRVPARAGRRRRRPRHRPHRWRRAAPRARRAAAATSSACRCTPPTTRCARSPAAPAGASRSSARSSACSSTTGAPDDARPAHAHRPRPRRVRPGDVHPLAPPAHRGTGRHRPRRGPRGVRRRRPRAGARCRGRRARPARAAPRPR